MTDRKNFFKWTKAWVVFLLIMAIIICDVILIVFLCRNKPLAELPEWCGRLMMPLFVFFTGMTVKGIFSLIIESQDEYTRFIPNGVKWITLGKAGCLLPGYWFVQHHNVVRAICCTFPVLAISLILWSFLGVTGILNACCEGFMKITKMNRTER